MLIQTREEGAVEIAPEEVLDFCCPIIGFERFHQFAIVPASEAPPFHWLQCLDEVKVAFPLVNSTELGVVYTPNTEVQRKLEVTDAGEVEFWVIVTIASGQGQMRMNLRAPVVVNRRAGMAGQIVMREEYPIRSELAAVGT